MPKFEAVGQDQIEQLDYSTQTQTHFQQINFLGVKFTTFPSLLLPSVENTTFSPFISSFAVFYNNKS